MKLFFLLILFGIIIFLLLFLSIPIGRYFTESSLLFEKNTKKKIFIYSKILFHVDNVYCLTSQTYLRWCAEIFVCLFLNNYIHYNSKLFSDLLKPLFGRWKMLSFSVFRIFFSFFHSLFLLLLFVSVFRSHSIHTPYISRFSRWVFMFGFSVRFRYPKPKFIWFSYGEFSKENPNVFYVWCKVR